MAQFRVVMQRFFDRFISPHSSGWDLIVRSTHWLVAFLFYFNYFYTETGEWWHRKIGYAIAALVLFRILWGLSFARHANHLKAFIPKIEALQVHLHEFKHRTPMKNVGHNPLGALAIYLIWTILFFTVFSGWLQDTDWGIDNDVDVWHEMSTDFLLYFSFLHITAVLITSWRLKSNLIRAMIIGKFKK